MSDEIERVAAELVPATPLQQLNRDPLALYLASVRSLASRRSLSSALTCVVRIFDALDGGGDPALSQRTAAEYPWGTPGALTYAKVAAAIPIIAEDHPPMAALACSALRGVARQAFNLGLLSVDERLRIDDVEKPKLSGETRGRRLTSDEIRRIAAACTADQTPRGRRDAAILAVLLGAGLRRFEAAALDLEHVLISRDAGKAVQLTVQAGKGKKFAVAPAPPDVAPVLTAWLAVRGRAPGALFPAAGGRGRPLTAGSRLSPGGVYLVCTERGTEAGVSLTPHDLRRTFVTTFLERTGDLAQAQKAARHARPETTVRYDKRGDDALLRAFAEAATGFTPAG